MVRNSTKETWPQQVLALPKGNTTVNENIKLTTVKSETNDRNVKSSCLIKNNATGVPHL
jgi:hypothetical protein